jgi:hypothetical protein
MHFVFNHTSTRTEADLLLLWRTNRIPQLQFVTKTLEVTACLEYSIDYICPMLRMSAYLDKGRYLTSFRLD